MTTITLNDTLRSVAKTSPTALLTVIGMYAATGRVNNIDPELIKTTVRDAHNRTLATVPPVREDFENNESFLDQVNQLTIMHKLRLDFNYPLEADNVPDMLSEMYVRIKGDPETFAAYNAISASTRRLEEAFLDKARTELF